MSFIPCQCGAEVRVSKRIQPTKCPECGAPMTSYEPGVQQPREPEPLLPPSIEADFAERIALDRARQEAPAPAVKEPKRVTEELPPMDIETEDSVADLLRGGPSEMGFHAISTLLECPEKYRLETSGVQRKGGLWVPGTQLNALAFGSVWHYLSAYRVIMGHNSTLENLKRFFDIGEDDRLKLFHGLQTYNNEFPLEEDPWEWLGVETEIVSDIGDGKGNSLLRTVRYDGIVRHKSDGRIRGIERKSSSKGGSSSMDFYAMQTHVQAAVWNANPFLTQKYGTMDEVIFDVLVKTNVPAAQRFPSPIPRVFQAGAYNFLRLPEVIRIPVLADGTYPQFRQSCRGRFQPCQYIALCWEKSYGEYETVPRGGA